MKKHYRTENDCLNCGTILEGKFCHNCGQENLQMKESFGHMMNHAISDYFHFDDQFFHTMRPLFLKPGFLTNEYLAGKRARYLHPVKMYIFISLVYFVLLFQSGMHVIDVNQNVKVNPKAAQLAIDSISKNPDLPDYLKKPIIAKIKQQANAAKTNNGIVKLNVNDDKQDANMLSPTTSDTTYNAYLAAQQKLPVSKRDGVLLKLYNKKAFTYKAEYGNRTKEVLLEQFEHNIPKMMFLLLPICALILMLAFADKRKYYVEYMIYTFHLHCFIFLFLSITIILKWLIPNETVSGWIDFLSTIAIIWYVYKSLRIVYRRSSFRTITKMIGASLMYLVSFTVCVTLVFFITALLA